MKRIIQLLLLLLISMAAYFATAPCVYACSCIPSAPPQEAREAATAVFRGTVSSVLPTTGTVGSLSEPVLVTFRVSQVWKGPKYTELSVATSASGASCGFIFEPNKEYLVYAYGSATALEASLCSRTRVITDADIQYDFQELGQPVVPTNAPPGRLPAASQPGQASFSAGLLVVLGAITIIGVLAAVGLAFRQPE
jgi:Tissue inhibitor of metalloproteinase